MIKRITALFCAVAAMSSVVANGAVLSEEEWTGLTQISPNPTQSKLTTLGPNITVSARNNLDNEITPVSKGAQATLLLPDGTSVMGLMVEREMWGMAMGDVSIKFASAFETPGEYVLTIPENTLQIAPYSGDPIGTNPEYDITFKVVEPKVIVNTLVDPVFIPASGSTVANIGNNISITFPKAETGWTLACFSGECIEVACVEGEWEGDTWTLNEWHWYDVDGTPDRSRCVFDLNRAITEPGKYEFRIKKGAFKTFIDDEEVYNEPCVGVFTIGEIGADELTLDSYKAVEPSNENPIKSLQVLHVEFPNCGAPEYGLEFGDKFRDPHPCQAPAASVKRAPEDEEATIFNSFYFTRLSDLAVRFATGCRILEDLKTVEVLFENPFTQDGDYTLTIPQGILKIRNHTPGIYNTVDLPVKYTLKANPDAVDEVTVVKVVVAPVYDLNGNKVLELATEADLQDLPAGIYIFNSRKIVVK